MQSTFTVRNMDSTPEPSSPNMAAAAPAKRKFRMCTHCRLLLVCLPLPLTTILYALNAEIRYVIWYWFVMNAAIGLLRSADFLLNITIVLGLGASTNDVRLG